MKKDVILVLSSYIKKSITMRLLTIVLLVTSFLTQNLFGQGMSEPVRWSLGALYTTGSPNTDIQEGYTQFSKSYGIVTTLRLTYLRLEGAATLGTFEQSLPDSLNIPEFAKGKGLVRLSGGAALTTNPDWLTHLSSNTSIYGYVAATYDYTTGKFEYPNVPQGQTLVKSEQSQTVRIGLVITPDWAEFDLSLYRRFFPSDRLDDIEGGFGIDYDTGLEFRVMVPLAR